MTSRKVLFLAVALVFHNPCIEGKSLGSLKLREHNIKKRSSYFQWQDTCPPPDFLSFLTKIACINTCDSDDDCLGNLLCCDNGCKMCMEPVLPPPVIDWLGSPTSYHRGFAAGGVPESNDIEFELTEPHIKAVECSYGGKTLTRGETFVKGCHKCQCKLEGISCKVGRCNIDETPNEEEQSGETSGEIGSHLNPVEALELSGDADDRILEYPVEPGTTKLESLTFRREERGGQKEVRIIPSFVKQERPSGMGEKVELSREETGEGKDRRSVEELQHSSGEGEKVEVGLGQQRNGKPREVTGNRGREETEEVREGEELDYFGKGGNKEQENQFEHIQQVGEGQEENSRQDVEHSSGEREHKEVLPIAQRKSREETRQCVNSNTLPKLRKILRTFPNNEEDISDNVLNI